MKTICDLDGTLAVHTQDVEVNNLGSYIVDCKHASVREEVKEIISPLDDLIIVTARPEFLRDMTEKWLSDNGIKYRELLMYEGKSLEEWKNLDPEEFELFKVETVMRENPDLVIDNMSELDAIKNACDQNITFIKVL